jgi:hypothetical protein
MLDVRAVSHMKSAWILFAYAFGNAITLKQYHSLALQLGDTNLLPILHSI